MDTFPHTHNDVATPAVALDFVRFAHASRHSADRRKRGGDFCAYDFCGGRLTLAIGDASAKQSQGVRIARILRRSFRASLRMSSPSQILAAMSDTLMVQARLVPPSPTFAAVLVATIDLAGGVLSYAAAGVEAGMVFGGASSHVHLGATGPLLGIERYPLYEERAMRFLPGDTLLAYTDGVTEAPAATPGAYVGSSGVARSMRRVQERGPLTIGALWEEIGSMTGHIYHDDATLAIVTTPKSPARTSGRLRVYPGGLDC